MVVCIALVCICLIFSTICLVLYSKYKKMLYLVLCAMTRAIHDNTLHTLLQALMVSTEYLPTRNGVGRYPANLTKALRQNGLHVERFKQRIIWTIVDDSHKALSGIMVEQNAAGLGVNHRYD